MERKEPVAFLSYVRADDAHDNGMILGLCERLSNEFHAQTGTALHIFVDRHDIDWGENWRARIYESLEAATVLIPIVTPRYFVSPACRDELSKFLDREKQLGRTDLVLPIYYIQTPRMEDPGHLGDHLAEELSRRQYVDWRPLRFGQLDSPPALSAIAELAQRMHRALQRGRTGASQLTSLPSPESTLALLDQQNSAKFQKDLRRRLLDSEAEHTQTFSESAGPRMLEYGDLLGNLEPGTAYLVIIRGPGIGGRFLIYREVTTIGRHAESDVFLGDISVSRLHASLHRMDNGQFQIRDNDSSNGVYVNGSRVSAHDLDIGDKITIGNFTFEFLSNQES